MLCKKFCFVKTKNYFIEGLNFFLFNKKLILNKSFPKRPKEFQGHKHQKAKGEIEQ